jgi:hypothetical protein
MSSLGAFGEPEDDPTAFGPNYEVERNNSSWATTPIEPPAALFENSGIINFKLEGVSQDFSRSLFRERPALAKPIDERFYIRQPMSPGRLCPSGSILVPDACLVEVGPAVPPATVEGWAQKNEGPEVVVLGTSRDLVHVLFGSAAGQSATSFLWPGDITLQGESLYEYIGTGHSGKGGDGPALVGVNGGPGSHELISQCGTDLGAAGLQDKYNAVSALGTTVLFTAVGPNSNNCGGMQPPADEIFARIDGSRTVAISEPSSGPTGDCSACNTSTPMDATFQGASEDGSKVFFLSEQALLPGATGKNLYEYDFNAPEHEKLTLVSGGVQPAGVQGVLRVSEQGARVYFVAEGVLASNENSTEEHATAGNDNLYVYEGDPRDLGQFRIAFIASLSGSDSADWASSDLRPVEATPDGRFLLFSSKNDLTRDAKGSGVQLYRYDVLEEKLVRVSIGEHGFNENGNTGSSATFPEQAFSGRNRSGPFAVSISDDGSYVFFQSPEALTPRALNNAVAGEPCSRETNGVCLARRKEFATNVYEYHEGQVYLISDGRDRNLTFGGSAVGLIGASPSGDDVLFKTADRLVPEDTNTQGDIYDARIDGGFPPPASPASCQGEECQGSLSQTQSLPQSASASLTAEGNLALPPVSKPKPKIVKCKKGFVKKPNKCVKRKRRAKKAKRARRSRTANR